MQKASLKPRLSVSEARSPSPNKSPRFLMQQNNGWHSISDLGEASFVASSSSPPPVSQETDNENNKNNSMTKRTTSRPSHYLGELVWQVRSLFYNFFYI